MLALAPAANFLPLPAEIFSDMAGDYKHIMPEQVYYDFTERRAALLKALTTDKDKFFAACSPARSALSLYGLPDGTWTVNEPVLKALPEPVKGLPVPAIGINFVRDKLEKHDWLAKVALGSDSWLYRVVYYFAGVCEFNSSVRKELFQWINAVPTLREEINSQPIAWPEGWSRNCPPPLLKIQSTPYPSSVHDILLDFEGRRRGIIKALTRDLKTFHKQCKREKEKVCLYGNSNGTWSLSPLVPESFLPQPTIGINYRGNRGNWEWLEWVAASSNAWLMAVVSFYASWARLDKLSRQTLFQEICSLETVCEQYVQDLSVDELLDFDLPFCEVCNYILGNDVHVECGNCEKLFHGHCAGVTMGCNQVYVCKQCQRNRNMARKVVMRKKKS